MALDRSSSGGDCCGLFFAIISIPIYIAFAYYFLPFTAISTAFWGFLVIFYYYHSNKKDYKIFGIFLLCISILELFLVELEIGVLSAVLFSGYFLMRWAYFERKKRVNLMEKTIEKMDKVGDYVLVDKEDVSQINKDSMKSEIVYKSAVDEFLSKRGYYKKTQAKKIENILSNAKRIKSKENRSKKELNKIQKDSNWKDCKKLKEIYKNLEKEYKKGNFKKFDELLKEFNVFRNSYIYSKKELNKIQKDKTILNDEKLRKKLYTIEKEYKKGNFKKSEELLKDFIPFKENYTEAKKTISEIKKIYKEKKNKKIKEILDKAKDCLKKDDFGKIEKLYEEAFHLRQKDMGLEGYKVKWLKPKKIREIESINDSIEYKSNEKKGRREDLDCFLTYLDKNYSFKVPKDPNSNVYLDDTNFKLFFNFISNTKKYLDIITNVFEEKIFLELINKLRKKGINIRIITRNQKQNGFLENDLIKDYFGNTTTEIQKFNQIHAKMMIRDGEKIILGSSNLTNASANKSGFYLDANIITENPHDVSLAKKIFDSIWFSENRINNNQKENNLLYSKNDKNHLPKCLEPIFKNEKEEIIILMSSGLIDKEIIDLMREWNRSVRIKIITSCKWPTNVIDENKLKTLNFLKDISESKNDKIKVIPKKSTIHAKLYLFKSQNIIFLSSQNLTINSWKSMLEAGYIIKDKELINRIIKKLDRIPDGLFDSNKNLIRVSKPKSTWIGSLSEKRKKIPWQLAEDDKYFIINKKQYKNIYYKIDKKNKKIKKTRSFYRSSEKEDINKNKEFINDILKNESRDPFIRNSILNTKKGSNFYKKELERAISEGKPKEEIEWLKNMIEDEV